MSPQNELIEGTVVNDENTTEATLLSGIEFINELLEKANVDEQGRGEILSVVTGLVQTAYNAGAEDSYNYIKSAQQEQRGGHRGHTMGFSAGR